MKRIVCAVYDSAVQAYGQPFFVPRAGAALRSFIDEVNKKDGNGLAQHPDDYTLMELGTFDDETGEFASADGVGGKVMLARGKDVKEI